MTDILNRLKASITDPVTGDTLVDDARPDLYTQDVREVIGEICSLMDRLRPTTHRLCLSCGKWWDAKKHPWGSQPCALLSREPDDLHPCTLDKTTDETLDHWRNLAHVYYERARRAEDRERQWTRGPEPAPWPKEGDGP
ncbi:UNVERIFIED_CONTAM: hypothetical protein BEN50_22290 [Euhalothece sp. KZN 001]